MTAKPRIKSERESIDTKPHSNLNAVYYYILTYYNRNDNSNC